MGFFISGRDFHPIIFGCLLFERYKFQQESLSVWVQWYSSRTDRCWHRSHWIGCKYKYFVILNPAHILFKPRILTTFVGVRGKRVLDPKRVLGPFKISSTLFPLFLEPFELSSTLFPPLQEPFRLSSALFRPS